MLGRCSCTLIKRPGQVERATALGNLSTPLLLNGRALVGCHDPACIEVLQLVVLWHEAGEDARELLNLRSQLEFLHEAIRVLLELLRLYLLVGVQLVNALVELLDFLSAFLIFALLVVLKVLQEDWSRKLRERRSEYVRLKLEELIDHVLVLHRVENVRG